MGTDAAEPNPAPHTVSHVFGEITWLLSQSEAHRNIPVGDLGWLVMPPILKRQYHLFRTGMRPVGVALWAEFDTATEEKVLGMISGDAIRLEDADWSSGNRLWLIELLAPFTTSENRQAELMVADLVAGPFAGRSFVMLPTDADSGKRTPISVGPHALEDLIKSTKLRAAENGIIK